MQRLHHAVGILVRDEDVDHADDVVLLEALQLGEHLALEVGLIEAHHEELYGTDHCAQPPARTFCFWASNSSFVRTPLSRSCASFCNCSTVVSAGGAAGAGAGGGACCAFDSRQPLFLRFLLRGVPRARAAGRVSHAAHHRAS